MQNLFRTAILMAAGASLATATTSVEQNLALAQVSTNAQQDTVESINGKIAPIQKELKNITKEIKGLQS